ncbi:MAG: BON domain-containing protein [Rhodothermales bacterium]|nr:BON domain-containing protein [Rhodothermales bacterium]MBO6779838.1 BON domain-containing protein [Rhodothermales bacterium]
MLRLLPERMKEMDPASDRDRRIARRLQDLFERDLALSEIGSLQFFVHKSSVVLKGEITSSEDRGIVMELIQSVPEVRRVVDHLSEVPRAA